MVKQITPVELEGLLQQNDDILLLDVREQEEFELCRIQGSTHIPMNEVTSRIDEISNATNIVAICHHGMRSMQVAQYLSRTGQFENIFNLSGGIDAWAIDVDNAVTRY